MSYPDEWPDDVDATWLQESVDEPQGRVCSVCEQGLRKGEVVFRPPSGEWMHWDCSGGAA